MLSMVDGRCSSSSRTGVMTTYFVLLPFMLRGRIAISAWRCKSNFQRRHPGPARRHVPENFDAFENAAFSRTVLTNPFRHCADAFRQSCLRAFAKDEFRLRVVGERDFYFVAGVKVIDRARSS